MVARQVDQCLALASLVPFGPSDLQHPLRLGDRLGVAREKKPDLAASLIDRHEPRCRHGRYALLGCVQGTGIKVQGRLVGIGALRLVPRPHEVLERARPLFPQAEVVGQFLVVVGQAVGVEFLDRSPNGWISTPLHREALIGDILDHSVLEDIRRLGEEPLLVDDLQRLQLAEQPLQLAGEPGDPLQEMHQKLAAR